MKHLDSLTPAVIKVGQGRGFIVRYRPPFRGEPVFDDQPLVITAAHCLPRIPRHLFDERPFKNLLGPLDTRTPKVWAECLFVDPVGDLAVLGPPDSQRFGEESESYLALTDDLTALQIGGVAEGSLWLLGLDGKWYSSGAKKLHHTYWLEGPTVGGMSGSPILSDRGHAIALVSTGSDTDSEAMSSHQPSLFDRLPGWLARQAKRSR